MKNISVYLVVRENNLLNLVTTKNGEDTIEKIKLSYSAYKPNHQGFNLTVLLEEKGTEMILTFLIGHLMERVNSNMAIKKFMEVNNLQNVKVHGHCKMDFLKERFVTFANEGHTYPYPHASTLIPFAGYLGLGAEFNGDETLPFQEVHIKNLK